MNLENDQEYKKCFADNSIYSRDKSPEPMPSEAELPNMRKTSYESLMTAERRDAQQNLVWASILLLISIAGFAAHRTIASRARNGDL